MMRFVVAKHGEHDQSTHGSWAEGASEESGQGRVRVTGNDIIMGESYGVGDLSDPGVAMAANLMANTSEDIRATYAEAVESDYEEGQRKLIKHATADRLAHRMLSDDRVSFKNLVMSSLIDSWGLADAGGAPDLMERMMPEAWQRTIASQFRGTGEPGSGVRYDPERPDHVRSVASLVAMKLSDALATGEWTLDEFRSRLDAAGGTLVMTPNPWTEQGLPKGLTGQTGRSSMVVRSKEMAERALRIHGDDAWLVYDDPERTRTAMAYKFADETMRAWAETSTGGESVALARAAEYELLLTVSRDQRSDAEDNPPRWATEDDDYPAFETPRKVMRALARAMYEETQERLRETFPDASGIRLYRGSSHGGLMGYGGPADTNDLSWAEQAPIATPFREHAQGDPDTLMSRLDVLPAEYNPLSSWSASEAVANSFTEEDGEFTAVTVVPFARVFATFASGVGASVEDEVVLVGGRIPIATLTERTEHVLPNLHADEYDIQVVPPAYQLIDKMLEEGYFDADGFIMVDGQPVPVYGQAVPKVEPVIVEAT